MEIIIVAIGIVLVFLCILRPMLQVDSAHEQFEALDQFRNFQAYAVRKYHGGCKNHPRISQMSLRELRKSYNISAAYQDLY